jgi:hypothetical protein
MGLQPRAETRARSLLGAAQFATRSFAAAATWGPSRAPTGPIDRDRTTADVRLLPRTQPTGRRALADQIDRSHRTGDRGDDHHKCGTPGQSNPTEQRRDTATSTTFRIVTPK